MTCIFINEVGLSFKVTLRDSVTSLPVDLTLDNTATKKLTMERPDGTVITHNASFFTDGSDGIITYTTIDGDLDMSGTWRIQAFIEGIGFANNTCIDTFVVSETLISV